MRPTFLLGAVEPQRDPCHSSWGLGGLCAGLSTASVLPRGAWLCLGLGRNPPKGRRRKRLRFLSAKMFACEKDSAVV